MQKRWILGILALFMMVLFVSGCGQNKLVGTWVSDKSERNGSCTVIQVQAQDDKTFSVSEMTLAGKGWGDEAEVDSPLGSGKHTLIGKASSDTVITVQGPLGGTASISYNKDDDTLKTVGFGKDKVSFHREKEDNIDAIKAQVLEAYKNSAAYKDAEESYKLHKDIENGKYKIP